MAKNTREIKHRIRSIRNTQQITKAMEMVAASKMRRAQEQALKTRHYAERALSILVDLAEKTDPQEHPLLTQRPNEKMLVITVSSNKGLCGGLNANVIRKSYDFLKSIDPQETKLVHSITVGKKIHEALFRVKQEVIADFSTFSDTPTFLEASPLTRMVVEAYEKEQYDRVVIIYTHYISTLSQRAVVKQLMPLSHDLLEIFEEVKKDQEQNMPDTQPYEYLFEPSPKEVLDQLLPRLVEMQIYQSLLEATASEHSARMIAMKNASDAAKDIIEELTLTYNQARQSSITQEIAEITSGAAALQT